MNHSERTDAVHENNSIQLLNVHVPDYGGNSSNSISIQLIPATPTDSQCSEGGSLLTASKRTNNDEHHHHHQDQEQQQQQQSDQSLNSSITISKDPLISIPIIDPYESSESLRIESSSRNARKHTGAPCNLDRVNIGEIDEMTIQGYVPSLAKKLMFYAGVVCTLGVLLLYAEWQPELKVKLTHTGCSLDEATLLLLKNSHGDVYLEQVERFPDQRIGKVGLIYFFHKKLKYVWHADQQQFQKLTGLEKQKCGVIYSYTSGLSREEAESKFKLYGPNEMDIQVKPIWRIVYDEMRTPFYMYQIFIVMVWILQLYYQFSLCVLFFSILSISLHAYETRKQSKLLRSKVHFECEVCVLRNSSAKQVSSSQLVPGDLLLITKPGPLCCDAVLVDGGSCMVNEAMLTGECVPVNKNSLLHKPDMLYSPDTNKKNTLYCGTEVVQVQPNESGHVKAVVVRTGFSTSKGELVRAILYPRHGTTQLHADMIRCMKMFFILGVPCMIYTSTMFAYYKVAYLDLFIIVIDIGTFLVPPLLPSVLTSVNVHAQKRLLKQQIFCLNSAYINSSGIVDVICFDKTGTLTEDTLYFKGVLPLQQTIANHRFLARLLQSYNNSNNNTKVPITATPFASIEQHPTSLQNKLKDRSVTFADEALPQKVQFLQQSDNVSTLPIDNLQLTLAACHSIIRLDDRLQGDPLELRMFEELHWRLLKTEQEQLLTHHFCCRPERVVDRQLDSYELQSYGLLRKSSEPQSNIKDNHGVVGRLVIGVLKQFPFESALQRMVVIGEAIIAPPEPPFETVYGHSYAKRRASLDEQRHTTAHTDTNHELIVMMKGAPETVASFCDQHTLPTDFGERLRDYTSRGYRVLACASRTIQATDAERINNLQQSDLEVNLRFDGFLLFHNRVKSCSGPTINELHRVRLRSVMVTGDNLMTAVHVARECQIVLPDQQLIQMRVEQQSTDKNHNNHSHVNGKHKVLNSGITVASKNALNEIIGSEPNSSSTSNESLTHVEMLTSETQQQNESFKRLKLTYTFLQPPKLIPSTQISSNDSLNGNSLAITLPSDQTLVVKEDYKSFKSESRFTKQWRNHLLNWTTKSQPIKPDINQTEAQIEENEEEDEAKQNSQKSDSQLTESELVEQQLRYQLCIDGRSFELLKNHLPSLWSLLIERGAVFARMTPGQKQQLVQQLQHIGHQVAMVGDGANDCAALRQANCGLSLSGEQSAMAAAFSTPSGSVQSLLPLLAEGRAALAATCGAFKYQVSYCFLLLGAVMLMFWDGIFNSDGGYVLIDIVLNIAPPLLFGTTYAARRLHHQRPNGRLFSWRTLLSIFSFVFGQLLLYLATRTLVRHQSWYEQPIVDPRYIKRSEPSHLALAILSVNMASYVIAAVIFAPGRPHRRSILSNPLYVGVIVLNALIVLCITVWPAPAWLLAYANFRDVPEWRFKITLLAISLVNFALCYAWEIWFMQQVLPNWLSKMERYQRRKEKQRKPYELLQQRLLNMQTMGTWPPTLRTRC